MGTYQRKCKGQGHFYRYNKWLSGTLPLLNLSWDRSDSNQGIAILKGESSYWINKNNLCKQKFEWQDEYFAISVSESMVDKVREYIKNQEDHHKMKTFEHEYNLWIEKYGFQKINR